MAVINIVIEVNGESEENVLEACKVISGWWTDGGGEDHMDDAVHISMGDSKAKSLKIETSIETDTLVATVDEADPN